MSNKKRESPVISRKVHEAEVTALNLQINNLKTEIGNKNAIIEAQKEELESKGNRIKTAVEDHVTTADSYATLLKEHEIIKSQYKTHMATVEHRLKNAIEDRNRLMEEKTALLDLYTSEKVKPWYKKLFNVKTK